MSPDHLLWPFFDESHRTLARSFDSWAEGNLRQYETDEGNDGIAARAIFKALGRDGWLRRTLLSVNSTRLDLRTVCLMREICAYSSAIADVGLSEPWLAALAIEIGGSGELKGRYLDSYAQGGLLPAFALSEPDAGSDVAAIQTTAHRDGRHYVLNGRKTWTSNAGLADLYVVFARLDDASDAISAFLVESADGGIVLDERLQVMSPHTVGTWHLENCRVPADRLLGEPGQGMRIALTALELFRPTVGAAAVGFARRAMDEALARSCDRVAFKRPISEYQLVQAKLADMVAQIDASSLLVYRAAWMHDAGEQETARSAAIAKLFATEAAQKVADEALQIFGGLGVVRGMTVERLYRHIRAFRIFDGTSEIQRLIIARSLLRSRDRRNC